MDHDQANSFIEFSAIEIQKLTLNSRFEDLINNLYDNLSINFIPNFSYKNEIKYFNQHLPTLQDITQLSRASAVALLIKTEFPYDCSIQDIFSLKHILIEHFLPDQVIEVNKLNKDFLECALYRHAGLTADNLVDVSEEEFELIPKFFSDSYDGVDFVDMSEDDVLNIPSQDFDLMNENAFNSFLITAQTSNLLGLFQKSPEVLVVGVLGNKEGLVKALIFAIRNLHRSLNVNLIENIPQSIEMLVEQLLYLEEGFYYIKQLQDLKARKLSERIEVTFESDMELVQLIEKELKNTPHMSTRATISETIHDLIADMDFRYLNLVVLANLEAVIIYQLESEYLTLVNTLNNSKVSNTIDKVADYEKIWPLWAEILATIAEHKEIKTTELYKLFKINGIVYSNLFKRAITLEVLERKRGCFLIKCIEPIQFVN